MNLVNLDALNEASFSEIVLAAATTVLLLITLVGLVLIFIRLLMSLFGRPETDPQISEEDEKPVDD